MSSEPKKPIEEMLEASAKARREAFGADPNMPNPMRARLHDEIARLEQIEPESSRSWLQMFWPRLAVAAAVATVVVIGPVMWWRQSNQSSMQVAGLGTNESSQRSEAAAPADEIFAQGPAAVVLAAPDVNLADNAPAKLQPEQAPASVSVDSGKDADLLADAPAAAAPPAVTKGLITKEAVETEGDTATVAAAAPMAARAKARADQSRQAGVGSDARKDQLGGGSAAPIAATASTPGASQRFAQQNQGQTFRNTAQRRQLEKRARAVLDNFEVQQLGNEIRVVDSDGSTYTGQLEPSAEGAKHDAGNTKRSYAARMNAEAKAEPVANAARFRATGYNVSLKKSVVFEGNFSQTPTPQEQEKAPNGLAKTEKMQETARIVGTARVNGEPPVEVDATAVPVGAK